MKLIFTIAFGLICAAGFSQTQTDLNSAANISWQSADKELNAIYKEILNTYEADTAFVQNLKVAQRIWISFRDAELKMKYPETEPGFYGGIFPMCASLYLEKLTRARIATLKEWIDGVDEGDGCAGSVSLKE